MLRADCRAARAPRAPLVRLSSAASAASACRLGAPTRSRALCPLGSVRARGAALSRDSARVFLAPPRVPRLLCLFRLLLSPSCPASPARACPSPVSLVSLSLSPVSTAPSLDHPLAKCFPSRPLAACEPQPAGNPFPPGKLPHARPCQCCHCPGLAGCAGSWCHQEGTVPRCHGRHCGGGGAAATAARPPPEPEEEERLG